MDWIKKFFGGFGFGDLLNGVGNIVGSVLNYKQQKKANETNLQIAQEANELQAAESEKAYERSKASNQVALMQQAGMSQAGAINALNGGGSYTPAPVNTAQVEAPQLDMSFLSSIAGNALQARTAEAQLKQQADQFKQEQDLKERQFNEEQLNNKVTRDLNEAQRKLIQTQTGLTEKQVEKLCADTELTFAQIKSEAAKYDLTLAQIAKVQEDTKLTTQQILQVKASTKLTEQQVLTEFERTGLTHEQAETAAKQYMQLSQQVAEFMNPTAIKQREEIRKFERDLQEFARNIKCNEQVVSYLDTGLREQQANWDYTTLGVLLRQWEYICSHGLPLKGLISIGKQ